jgi:hypothetical protein
MVEINSNEGEPIVESFFSDRDEQELTAPQVSFAVE